MSGFFQYMGSKKKMLDYILPNIPSHKIYVEPFAGSAAVLFAKQPSKIEVINDVYDDLINFYRIAQKYPKKFMREALVLPYAEAIFLNFRAKMRNNSWNNNFERALGFWYMQATGFNGCITGNIGKSRGTNMPKRFAALKQELPFLLKRIDAVYIEHRDGFECIKYWDTPDTFFFIDPPYHNSYQRYLHTYTEEQFSRLIDVMHNLHGKCMFTYYADDFVLSELDKIGFDYITIEIKRKLKPDNNYSKHTVEVIATNYGIKNPEEVLYDGQVC